MKKFLLLIITCLLLSALTVSACAYVSVTPNQELALRTGPNTKYVWLYHLPQSTRVTAIELEEGNGVPWVLVEYSYKGETVRGYTGLKRFDVYGNLPWANHIGSTETIARAGSVLAAPTHNAAYRGKVDQYESVTLLDYENGYAYIEFYDAGNGANSRGYVEKSMIKSASSGGSILITPNTPSKGAAATPNQKLFFRSGPNTAFTGLFTLPQSTKLVAYEYEEGNGVPWVLVEFEYQGMVCRAYTGLKRMEVHGNIPWADHLWESNLISRSSTVLAAPCNNAYYRGHIDAGTYVSILGYENGYAYIEYYDSDAGADCRGYVPVNVVR